MDTKGVCNASTTSSDCESRPIAPSEFARKAVFQMLLSWVESKKSEGEEALQTENCQNL